MIIEVISQICYQCFAPIERRPTMIQIHAKLAELNCKYQAAKFSRCMEHNIDLQKTLLYLNSKITFQTYPEVMYIIRFQNFKLFKQEYLSLLDHEEVEPEDFCKNLEMLF